MGFTTITGSTVLGGDGADSIGSNAVLTDASIVGGSGSDTFNVSSSAAASTFFFGFGSGTDTLTTDRTGASASYNTFVGTIAVSATYGGTGSVSGSVITFGTGNTLTLDGAITGASIGTNISFVTVSQASIDSLG